MEYLIRIIERFKEEVRIIQNIVPFILKQTQIPYCGYIYKKVTVKENSKQHLYSSLFITLSYTQTQNHGL